MRLKILEFLRVHWDNLFEPVILFRLGGNFPRCILFLRRLAGCMAGKGQSRDTFDRRPPERRRGRRRRATGRIAPPARSVPG